jgi:tetratricopeptide (TPR) repeat protein
MRILLFTLALTTSSFAFADDDCSSRTKAIIAEGGTDAEQLSAINRLPEQCTADGFTRYTAAQLYAATGELNSALELLSTELDLGEYAEPARVLESRIFLLGGKPDIAKQVLRQTIIDYPEKSSAAMLYGEILLTEGKGQEAFDSFIHSLQAKPTARAYRGASVAAYRIGDCEQAVTALDQAMYLDEEGTQKSWSAMVTGARCFTQQGKFRAATGALKALVEADENAMNRKAVKDTVLALRAAIRKAQESGDQSTDADQITLRDIDL